MNGPSFTLTINGRSSVVNLPDGTPLLYVLRNDFELNGPKYGCGLGQCGACTVLVDGVASRSCLLSVADVNGTEITTLEGLGTRETPHPLQRAFIDQQAMQCGYCSNGMIMTAAGFLRENGSPTLEDIRDALDGNLCRCGAHNRILRAVAQAVEGLADESED